MSKEEYTDWDIYKRDACTCHYCGFSGLGNLERWRQLVIDHVLPTTHDGPDTPENKVVSCNRCNNLLHAFRPEGHTTEQRVASKCAYLRERNLKEYKDYRLMMSEISSQAGA